MKSSWQTPARSYAAGIGTAVADRTINRKKADGTVETWEDVAYRVALGNASLAPKAGAQDEFEQLHHHLRQASILMSGRHLQHGDVSQPERNQEVFTNCSTAASSFILFYLLLNGSGVGRAYDNDMMLVDWSRNMPKVVTYVRADHPDVLTGEIPLSETDDLWRGFDRRNTVHYLVPDSREGWAKAIEQIEYLTYEGTFADATLILDFSDVRPRGAPIAGMQNRPASGPATLMTAIQGIASLKGSKMPAWKATMHVDHYLSECVLVGGARRAARMATKTWRDHNVMDFIEVKRGGVLWSSNNSVTVDEEFWRYVKTDWNHVVGADSYLHADMRHAKAVFERICECSYHDGTGEPGIINVERLTQKNEGLEVLFDGDYAESKRFKLDERTKLMTAELARVFASKEFTQITNPCGEISLSMLGGYCVIADVVPFHAANDDDAEDAFRAATRALIRVNTMDCLYGKEVKRTNRIGVGFTGLHEYAFARFGYGWKDIVDESKSLDFWLTMRRFSNAVFDEARKYATRLGLAIPHTSTTVKPAGTTSKLFGLTEGAHLPSMREFLRWVQFRSDDPLIAEYEAKGYPVRKLVSYSGTTVVGFPTVPSICTLGMGDLLVTAAEATPEEQYEYLRLLEKYWIDADHDGGNQVSYTLKYDPKVVSFEAFRQTLLDGQSTVKCCSVMPQADTTAYEYQPEEPVTTERFQELLAAINDDNLKQDINFEHLDCGAGGCPIDFNEVKVA